MKEWTPEDDRRAYLGLIAQAEQDIALGRECLQKTKAAWLESGLHAHYCRYVADRMYLADLILDQRRYVLLMRELEAST